MGLEILYRLITIVHSTYSLYGLRADGDSKILAHGRLYAARYPCSSLPRTLPQNDIRHFQL